MRELRKTAAGFAVIFATSLLAGACGEDDIGLDPTTPHVTGVERERVVIGQTLDFYGQNFLPPSEGKTVLEHSPRSTEAEVFRGLAQCVLDSASRVIPTPFEQVEELEALYRRHLERQANPSAARKEIA